MSEFCFFSFVLPTYNRPGQLKTCLQSLAGLSYPSGGYEVIVVDDGSRKSLDAVVREFTDQLNITLIRQQNAGPASARNKGAGIARGKYLAFIDDDCRPAPDWGRLMAQQIEKTPDRLLGGRTVNALVNNTFSAASQFIVDIVYAHYNADRQAARFFASNNMVIPRALFAEMGGFAFNWHTSEDRELCDRWLWKGHQMYYLQEAVVYHAHRLNFRKFCRQHFNYGKGAYHYHRIRKNRRSGSMIQEMRFHANLKNWLLAPFYQRENDRLSLFFLLLLWQMVNLLGFLWAAAFERNRFGGQVNGTRLTADGE